jgi:SHAQKYF class myb-like DNA-binding protein
MSESSQAPAPSEHSQEQPTAPSTSYNPLADGDEQTNSAVGPSIVQDLMSVYESLTQSSAPQTISNHGPQKPIAQQAPFESHPLNQQFATSSQEQPLLMQGHGSTQSHSMQRFQAPDQVYHQQQIPQSPTIHYHHAPQKPFYGLNPYQQSFGSPVQSFAPVEQPPILPSSEDIDSDDVESESRARRKRSGSITGGGTTTQRKKSKNSDGRWSKRFTWPEDLHRDFVSAIFDVGLKHSSPSAIIEHMSSHPDITTERIKSHLQKYRLHRSKSKQEFMSSYEASLVKFKAKGIAGVKSLANGDAAAHLTYTATTDPRKVVSTPENQQPKSDESQPVMYEPQVNEALMLPQLSEAEKHSPIGASMGFLMGLFFSLKQQLAKQRSIGGGDKVNPVACAATDNKAPMIAGDNKTNIDSPQQHDARASRTTEDAPIASHPSSSRNIEVNSNMKRDMQNQMVFQKKMRALKQEQLNKCKNEKDDKDGTTSSLMGEGGAGQRAGEVAGRDQVAGDNAGQDGASGENARLRGLSIAHSEDFWNTDIVDEQLFEFLMNN